MGPPIASGQILAYHLFANTFLLAMGNPGRIIILVLVIVIGGT